MTGVQREVQGGKEDCKTSGEWGKGAGLWGPLPTFEYEGMREDIYRVAKTRDRKTRDFNQVKFIKDEREL